MQDIIFAEQRKKEVNKMTNEKKEIIKKIATKLEGVSVEDARYIQGYLEGKTEELEKEEKRSA